MSFLSITHNQRGVALLNLVFVFIFIGVLAVSGMKMYDSIVARTRITDSKIGLENQVRMIVAWSEKNGRLPTGAEYAAVVFGATTPIDSWGRPVAYIYDDTLANTANGGLCGRTGTNLSDSGVAIGFALVSGGEDHTFDTLVNGSIVTAPPPYVTVTAAAPLTNYQKDIYRAVPLEELKNKAGCYGQTGGRLAIINNELPTVCSGSTVYPATLYANGGVAGYTWSLTTPPAWLTLNATTGVFSPNPSITSSAGTYPLTVTVVDGQANSVQRTYNLTVISCAPPPPTPTNPISFTPPSPTVVENNWNGGTANDTGTYNTEVPSGKFAMTMVSGTLNAISLQNGTKQSCIWYQAPLPLTGKQMRSYYNFNYSSGGGFAFAMVPAAPGQTTIASCGSNGATDVTGFDTGIPGNTLLGAEFIDNQPNGTACITTLGINASGSSCSGNNLWVEGQRYYVRAELDTRTAPYNYQLWVSNSLPAKFTNLSTAYTGSTPTLTKTLTSTNISDLSIFFLGFTTAQHGNNKVDMNVQGLKFVLCQPGAPGCY